jgi:cell division protease FtsH
VSIEERFMDAITDAEQDEEVCLSAGGDRFPRRAERLHQKHKAAITDFLGEGNFIDAVVIKPRYYGELLTWALYRHAKLEGWTVMRTMGYRSPSPVFIDVDTGDGASQNLLRDGLLFIRKGDTRLIVTVDIYARSYNSIVICGSDKEKVLEFREGVETITSKENFYKSKALEFAGRIRFLKLPARNWEDVILEPGIKREISVNTIDFLAGRERLATYGIPPKRGVLLAGDPGTGKTLVCKALMAQAKGITCILAHAYALGEDEYITELYELAQDLSPSIVFIEDIDLITQNRVELGYSRGPALLSLLSALDGVEEHHEIVTVATTNHLEIIDKAIGHRPSRFDRVIKLPLPSLQERKQLVELLSQKIPLEESSKEYIARKAEHCTPAQLQEIIFSLAILHCSGTSEEQQPIKVAADDINSVISKINGKNGHRLGFCTSNANSDRSTSLSVNIQ